MRGRALLLTPLGYWSRWAPVIVLVALAFLVARSALRPAIYLLLGGSVYFTARIGGIVAGLGSAVVAGILLTLPLAPASSSAMAGVFLPAVLVAFVAALALLATRSELRFVYVVLLGVLEHLLSKTASVIVGFGSVVVAGVLIDLYLTPASSSAPSGVLLPMVLFALVGIATAAAGVVVRTWLPSLEIYLQMVLPDPVKDQDDYSLDDVAAIAAWSKELDFPVLAPQMSNHLGLQLFESGRYEEARAAFQDAVNLQERADDASTSPLGPRTLGFFGVRREDVRLCRLALYTSNLGDIAYFLGRWEEARTQYRAVLALGEDAAFWVPVGKAQLARSEGKWEEALKVLLLDLKTSQESDEPVSAQRAGYFAATLAVDGHWYDQALRIADSFRREPHDEEVYIDPRVMQLLGVIAASLLGRTQDAMARLDSLRSRNSRKCEYLRGILTHAEGIVAHCRGDPDEAEMKLRSALSEYGRIGWREQQVRVLGHLLGPCLRVASHPSTDLSRGDLELVEVLLGNSGDKRLLRQIEACHRDKRRSG